MKHNEMVERVAQAISLWDGNDWDGQIGGRNCVRNRYRDMARAAIEAMREPTTQMVECSGGTPKQKKYMALRYKDMIDAAADVEFY